MLFGGQHDSPQEHERFLVDPEGGGAVGPLDLHAVAVAAVDLARLEQRRLLGVAQQDLHRLVGQQQHRLRHPAADALRQAPWPTSGRSRASSWSRAIGAGLTNTWPGRSSIAAVEIFAVANHHCLVGLHANLVRTFQREREIRRLIDDLFAAGLGHQMDLPASA